MALRCSDLPRRPRSARLEGKSLTDVGAVSGKNIVWIVAACVIAAIGAVVALLATGFFDATEPPADSPFALQDAEAGDSADASTEALPSSPAPRHSGPPPEFALAERLLNDIPGGAKVALQPLDQRYAGLEPAVGDPLYERILLALTNAAEDGVTLLARERLRAIYNSLEEFYQGDIESLLRNAQADIEIICKPTSNATGIILSCSAVRLVNAVTLATAAAHFPISRRAAHFDVAIDAIASRLAQGAPPGTVALVPLLDTGVETGLTRRIGERLEDKIATAMAKRLGSRAAEVAANAVLADGKASDSDVPHYRLRGELRRLDDQRFRVDARLLLGERKLIADGADMAIASVPADLASSLSRSDGAPEPTKRYEAVAEAVVSERLDAASARRAARNLARARVIAQALGLDSPAVDEVRTEADAVAALGEYLGKGLPVEEEFHDLTVDDGGRTAVRLRAKVVPVGTVSRPAVTAKLLKKTVFKAMEPISIELRSEAKVYLGIYAWGADNRVVRLYPTKGSSQLRMEAGQVLVIPSQGEGRIRSEPLRMEGNFEDHEALIVVAATESVDYGNLAPVAGATLTGTMDRARQGGEFIAALGLMGIGRMSVTVLNYQVHL